MQLLTFPNILGVFSSTALINNTWFPSSHINLDHLSTHFSLNMLLHFLYGQASNFLNFCCVVSLFVTNSMLKSSLLSHVGLCRSKKLHNSLSLGHLDNSSTRYIAHCLSVLHLTKFLTHEHHPIKFFVTVGQIWPLLHFPILYYLFTSEWPFFFQQSNSNHLSKP